MLCCRLRIKKLAVTQANFRAFPIPMTFFLPLGKIQSDTRNQLEMATVGDFSKQTTFYILPEMLKRLVVKSNVLNDLRPFPLLGPSCAHPRNTPAVPCKQMPALRH